MAAAVPDKQPPAGDPNAAELDLDDAENPQDAFDRATFLNVFVQGPPWNLRLGQCSNGMQPAPPLSLASGTPQQTRTYLVNSVTYLGKERMDDEGSEILHLCSSVYYRSRIFALPILASEQIGVAAIAVCVRGLTRGGGIDACLKTHVPAKEMIALSALFQTAFFRRAPINT